MEEERWEWTVKGFEYRPQTALPTEKRPFEDSGTVQAEVAGEALDELVKHGEFWDNIDQDHEVTITVTPVV